MVSVPDLIKPTIEAQFKNSNIHIHVGANLDTIIIVPADKPLSKENQERIRILTDTK